MATIKVICPICGKETQANDERSFAFCTECGNRFELEQTKQGEHAPSANVNEADPQAELEKGLEEAAFYYNLSYEKKEADHLDKRPEYYEKAQEKLLSLSQSFPSDYRVWWELSKPLDYNDPAGTKDVKGDFGISEKYFNKALDLSTLEGKKELISKKDKYDTEKRKVIETHLRKIEEKKAAEEKERQAQLRAEQEKKLAEQQEQLRLKEEAEKEKAERARQRKEALNEEKPVLIAGILQFSHGSYL